MHTMSRVLGTDITPGIIYR